MKSSAITRVILALLLAMQPLFGLEMHAATESQYSVALPGYHYEFPRDYFNHPDYQTEWWYYTGNVTSADGRHFGFELTFFRQGVSRDAAKTNAWDVRDLYLAHLALSDLDGGRFYHAERTNRAGPGIAGVNSSAGHIWNGNWEIQSSGEEQTLAAVDPRFQLQFTLRSGKPPVIQGENGMSQKASGAGHASHYISLTRLTTSGSIVLNGKTTQVTGLAWMDHEFFTHQLETNQIGWDWFSVQLDDNTELMLFRIRRKDGSVDPFSAATFVDARGQSTHLRSNEFSLRPGETWTSPVTKADYPVQWRITVPKFGIELDLKTPLPSQELTSSAGTLTPSYWEGAVTYDGARAGTQIHGAGYLEMTGYDRPFVMGSN
ncbi:MAG TPA: lipocalin-like domain-containing protein [Candidatus Sulfotelmatobacter sp.]|nr:lipocalin-like domain-containing protein [Candidatus Sulfotelmatobacter sp.]